MYRQTVFFLCLLRLHRTHYYRMCTPSTLQLRLFYICTSFFIYSSWYLNRLGQTKEWQKKLGQNAEKYGETAGFTCLTLQPVLALVSMNMTFNSLALCSPSSIMICLQENQARLSNMTSKHNLFSTDMLTFTTCFLLSKQNILLSKTTLAKCCI